MSAKQCWCGRTHKDATGITHRRESGNYRVRYRDPAGLWRTIGTFDTLTAAKQARDAERGLVATGTWTAPAAENAPTLAQYAARWLARGQTSWAPNTYAKYERDIRRWINAPLTVAGSKMVLGDYPLAKINRRLVTDWHAALRGATTDSVAVSAYATMRTILVAAVDDELIASNPARVKGAGRLKSAERPLATPDEVRRLADALPPRLSVVVDLACWANLRRGEVLGLQRGDVTILRGDVGEITGARVAVNRSIVAGPHGSVDVREPKTAKSRRVVAVDRVTAARLADHLAVHVGASTSSWLFESAAGGPWDPNNLYKRHWIPAREAIGRSDLHIHDLRHTGLTEAARTGATTAAIMARAGHTQPDTAMRYQHAVAEDDQRIARLLESVVLAD